MPTKCWIGIDNGKLGAIVALGENGLVLDKIKMPMDGKHYDIQSICKFLTKYDVQMVTLEGTFCGRFAQPAMMLGFCKGMLEGICVALKLRYAVVKPQRWQKEVLAGLDLKDTKNASITFAKRMWPNEDWVMGKTPRARKVHDGLTDAACLAYYGKMRS
jgi:hypothetical protein